MNKKKSRFVSGSAHSEQPYFHIQQLLSPVGPDTSGCGQPEPQPEGPAGDCAVCYDSLPDLPPNKYFGSCHGDQICGGCADKVDMCPLCREPKPGREAGVADLLSPKGKCAPCTPNGADADAAMEHLGNSDPTEHPRQHLGAMFTVADEFGLGGHLDAIVGAGVFREVAGDADTELDKILVELWGANEEEAEAEAGAPKMPKMPTPEGAGSPAMVQLMLPDRRPTALAVPLTTPPPAAEQPRAGRKRKKTVKAEAADAAPLGVPGKPAPTRPRAADTGSQPLRDRNAAKVARTSAKSPAQPAQVAASKASKGRAPKAKDPEVVGQDSPFAGVGLSDDRVCDMPFGDLVVAMETAGFSKELTAEGKAYRKRLKNRRHVMQYSNRKKVGTKTLNGQNDNLKSSVVSLQTRNDRLVSANERLSHDLQRATAVQQKAAAEMQALQSEMAALKKMVLGMAAGS